MRPKHPDFELIARIARECDITSENDEDLPTTMAKISTVDLESLEYLAMNRAGILIQRIGLPRTVDELQALIGSAIMNGFVIGENFSVENRSLDGIIRQLKAQQKQNLNKEKNEN